MKASSGTQPVNEDPIAANPVNSMWLESGGNDYNCSSLQGFYNSDNGGANWRRHCMPIVGAGGCGDPNVAYDRNGKAYILGIGDCDGFSGSIVFQTSTDNGVTWAPARTAFGSLLGGLTDKEWTEIDTSPTSPFLNCVYVSWTDFDSSFTKTRASVAHSCDGGNTWLRKPVDVTRTVPVIDQFTDLAIAADGTVWVSWMQCHTSGPSGDCGGTSVSQLISKSTDGGNTWSTAVKIADVTVAPDTAGCYYGCFPGTSERVSNIPTIDYDESTGRLWAGFYNYTGGKAKAVITSSTDGGATWGPLVVPGNTGNQGWVWLSTNDAGRVALAALHSATNGKYIAGVTLTSNGTTFTKHKLSSVPPMSFSNDGFGGGFIGDYIGSIWTGDTLHVSWMDTRSGGVSSDMTGGIGP